MMLGCGSSAWGSHVNMTGHVYGHGIRVGCADWNWGNGENEASGKLVETVESRSRRGLE